MLWLLRIILICLIWIHCNKNCDHVEYQNADNAFINKYLLYKKFSIMDSKLFSGIFRIKELKSNMDLIIITGKYDKRINNKHSFILLLSSSDSTGIKKESLFEFYTDHIDNIFYKNEMIYIVFEDQTELYGWIKWQDNKFVFEMFHDPEL